MTDPVDRNPDEDTESTWLGLTAASTPPPGADLGERTHAEGDARAVLARLFRDAGEDGQLTAGWAAAMSAVLLRSFERRDLDILLTAQEGLRAIAAAARRILVQASLSDAEGISGEDKEAAQARLLTASAFVSMADAGAAIARPAAVAYQPDWDTIPGKILATLSPDKPTFGRDVRDRVRTTESQLSRAFKLLLEHGLVDRRHFGKQAAWTLTTTGAQAVADAPFGTVIGDLGSDLAEASPVRPHVFAGGSFAWATNLEELDEVLKDDPEKIFIASARGRQEILPAAMLTKLRYGDGDEVPGGHYVVVVPRIDADVETRSAYLMTPAAGAPGRYALLRDKLFSAIETSPDKALRKTSYETIVGHGVDRLADEGDQLKVVPAKGWDIVIAETDEPLWHTTTQREAVSRARSVLSNRGGGQVIIHGKTGKMRKQSVDPTSEKKGGAST